jgi:hypothetical protein
LRILNRNRAGKNRRGIDTAITIGPTDLIVTTGTIEVNAPRVGADRILRTVPEALETRAARRGGSTTVRRGTGQEAHENTTMTPTDDLGEGEMRQVEDDTGHAPQIPLEAKTGTGEKDTMGTAMIGHIGETISRETNPAHYLPGCAGEIAPQSVIDRHLVLTKIEGVTESGPPTDLAETTTTTAGPGRTAELLLMLVLLKRSWSRSARGSLLPCRRQPQIWTKTDSAVWRPSKRASERSVRQMTGRASETRSTEGMQALRTVYIAEQLI